MPVAVVSLGEPGPALQAGGPAATGGVDRAPVEFPLVTAAQRAGERDSLGPPLDRGHPGEHPGDPRPQASRTGCAVAGDEHVFAAVVGERLTGEPAVQRRHLQPGHVE